MQSGKYILDMAPGEAGDSDFSQGRAVTKSIPVRLPVPAVLGDNPSHAIPRRSVYTELSLL